MSRSSDRCDPEELLAEIGWLQSLARQLCGDAHAAEDLAQDALLVALDGRVAERPASLRGWFAAVLRNLGRTRRRSERRRAEREAEVARRDPAPSTGELVERAATQRELVGALLRLREPYRSTLLLRFYAGNTQREIAARTGVPVSTVGTRIADGLAQLRRKVGSRDRWFSVFATPLGFSHGALAFGSASGVLLMTLKAKLILAAGLALGVCTVWSGDPGAPLTHDVRTVAPPAVPAGAIAESAEAAVRQDATLPTAEPAAPAGFEDVPAHAGLVRTQVHGRVLDLGGAAVAYVEVQRMRAAGRLGDTGGTVPARALGSVTADQEGRFEVVAVPPFWLQVRDDRYVTVCEGAVGRPTEREVLVVVAPRIPLGGVVVDDAGLPLAGVRVSLRAEVRRAGHDLSTSSTLYPEVDSDQQGHFAFAEAGAVPGAQLQFHATGFELSSVPVPIAGDAAMQVVLRRASSACTITGRVVLEDGSPAVGALVSTGVMASPVDANGVFAIDFEPWRELRVDENAPIVVTAVRGGLMPAVRTLPSAQEARTAGWPRDLVLKQVGTPRAIRGVVVDESGEPLAGVLVEPTDLTPFGIVQEGGMPAGFGVPKSLEQLAGGGSTHTAADGSFELGGLADRTYSLCALQQPTLLSAVSAPVAAGETGVRIVLDGGGLGTLAGRIVGRDGQGIGGVRVAVSQQRITELVIGRSVTTGPDGSFALDGVTRAPAFLRLEGEAIVPELFRRLDPGSDTSALELTVGRRRRVQFDWTSWQGRSDEVRIVDARDRSLMMMLLRGNSIGERDSMPFQDGVTDTLVVADSAAFAVISREGAEVTRVRLDLSADELHVIRL